MNRLTDTTGEGDVADKNAQTCDRCGTVVKLRRVGTAVLAPEAGVREGDEVHEWLGEPVCPDNHRHVVGGVLRSYVRNGRTIRLVRCG